MDWVSVFIAVGAVHSVLLALYAGAAARRKASHTWLATLFALLAVAVTAILITHRTEGAVERIAVMVEEAAAWFVGPILFAYVHDAIDRPLAPRQLALHLTVPALVTLIQTVTMLLTLWWPLPWAVVLYLSGYSLASAIAFARGRRSNDRSARGFWWPIGTLSTMFAIHAGQALRLAAPEAGRDAVPMIGALAASLALLILLLTLASRGGGGPRYARSALGRDELQSAYDALVRTLDGPPPLYLRLDLSLGELSAAANVPAHHASQAISEIGGGSFYELLTARRVAEAQRRLVDAGNANVAVEALGMESGFRSRSAFYAAFKAATGVTPAEFRRQGGQIVSRTPGLDQDARSKR
jgi:AraC-like DNA-binding protein